MKMTDLCLQALRRW